MSTNKILKLILGLGFVVQLLTGCSDWSHHPQTGYAPRDMAFREMRLYTTPNRCAYIVYTDNLSSGWITVTETEEICTSLSSVCYRKTGPDSGKFEVSYTQQQTDGRKEGRMNLELSFVNREYGYFKGYRKTGNGENSPASFNGEFIILSLPYSLIQQDCIHAMLTGKGTRKTAGRPGDDKRGTPLQKRKYGCI